MHSSAPPAEASSRRAASCSSWLSRSKEKQSKQGLRFQRVQAPPAAPAHSTSWPCETFHSLWLQICLPGLPASLEFSTRVLAARYRLVPALWEQEEAAAARLRLGLKEHQDIHSAVQLQESPATLLVCFRGQERLRASSFSCGLALCRLPCGYAGRRQMRCSCLYMTAGPALQRGEMLQLNVSSVCGTRLQSLVL